MLFVSQGAYELTGYTVEEILHGDFNSYEALTYEPDRKAVRKQINEAIRAGERFNIEYRIQHADGSLRWVLESGSPIFNESGAIEALEGFIQDITQRKRNEEALKEAEARYRSIFNNAIEGIYQTTADGQYLNFNPALAKIYGYDSADDLAQGILDIDRQLYVQPGKRAEFIRIMREHGVVHNFEAQVYRKNGEVIWISENAREVRDEAGKLLFYEGTVEDVTERRNHEQQLEYLATHDSLTSLPNRTLLADRLQQCISFADRHQEKLAVAFIDLDEFKLINDSMGHHVGDQLLVEMSKRLLECVRESDTLVRLGGDEFVMLLTGLQKGEDVAQSMQRILSTVSQPFVINGWDYSVSCSIGVSLYPDDGRDPGDILKHADAAMFKAKQSGRNNFQFYTSELNRSLMERLDVEFRLRQALERQEFLLYYQPKMDFSTGRVCGAEALIRWQPHGEPMVSPLSFIPIAEESGLIKEIGEWVMREACCMGVRMQELHQKPMPIAVNVSPRQFRNFDLVGTIERVLQETHLDPGLLEIEITEGTLVYDTPLFIKTLHELKKIGVKLSIDDFGTGYSSMAYLKDFPVDRLKIDKAFVSNLESTPRNVAILKAIIALGHGLNLKVVAEGVETSYQQAFLHGIGCHELQGYVFSKPLTEQDCVAFILSH